MALTNNLQISYRATSTVQVNRHNARSHSKAQISQIAVSIEKFGFTNPILVDEDAVLIAGHGRLRAAQALGLERLPTIELKGLSDVEKRALLLADNKIALNAGWDTDLLKVELGNLKVLDMNFDFSLTGFSAGEIDVILQSSNVDPDDEEIPAIPDDIYVKPGDVFRLGSHIIGCGDCRDGTFLQSLVGDTRKVDAAFLDPPYNVSIKGHANRLSNHREFAMASGEMTASEFDAFLLTTLASCASVTRDGGVHFVCMDWRHINALQNAGELIYCDLINLAVWNKSSAGMGSLYRSKHELVFIFKVGNAPHFNAVELGKHGRNRTNVWDYASANSLSGTRREDLKLHPTVKPVAMVSDAICDVTRQGDLVLDAFLGSGTTLIAAERSRRQFVGCDIDAAYVQVAIERWRDLTGHSPEKIATRAPAHV